MDERIGKDTSVIHYGSKKGGQEIIDDYFKSLAIIATDKSSLLLIEIHLLPNPVYEMTNY